MLLPSEIEAKSLIPAIRAILAKKLIKEYKMKEEIVAKVLGVTQAAISNYVRGIRGDIELIDKLSSFPLLTITTTFLNSAGRSSNAYIVSSVFPENEHAITKVFSVISENLEVGKR